MEAANDVRSNKKSKDDTYRRSIQILLFLSRISRPKNNVCTRKEAIDSVHKIMCSIGEIGNRVLWTTEQFKAVRQNSRRVFLNSRFGSGKTVLLLHKCLESAKAAPDQTFFYFVMPALVERVYERQTVPNVPILLPTLIERDAKKFFEGCKNITVMTWADMYQDNPNSNSVFNCLRRFVEKHSPAGNFFIDEYHEGYWESVRTTRLKKLVRFSLPNSLKQGSEKLLSSFKIEK